MPDLFLPLKPGQREELSRMHVDDVSVVVPEGVFDDFTGDLFAIAEALKGSRYASLNLNLWQRGASQSDLRFLEHFPFLRQLSWSNSTESRLENLNGIELVPNLERLSLSPSDLSLAPIASLSKLREFTLTGIFTEMESIQHLTELEELHYPNLMKPSVFDLGAIKALPKLYWLTMNLDCSEGMDSLSELRSLQHLAAFGKKSWSFLSGLRQVRSLSFGGGPKPIELPSLSKCEELHRMSLYNPGNIAALAELPHLRELTLVARTSFKASDLEVLRGHPTLEAFSFNYGRKAKDREMERVLDLAEIPPRSGMPAPVPRWDEYEIPEREESPAPPLQASNEPAPAPPTVNGLKSTPPPPLDPLTFGANLGDYAKTGVRLLPVPVKPAPSRSASKIGGTPVWPSNEPWPVGEEGESCVLLIQLRKDEFPEISFPGETELLQILWAPRYPDLEKTGRLLPVPVVVWRKAPLESECLAAAPRPSRAEAALVPWECRLNPERIVEYPRSLEFGLDVDWEKPDVPEDLLENYEDDALLFYDNELSAAPGTKVAGWGYWIQGPDTVPCPQCGNRMELLLTLGSDEYFGRTNERWSAFYEDIDELPEDLDSHPMKGPGCWTGLSLLDTAYFHYCKACEDRPVQMTSQSG